MYPVAPGGLFLPLQTCVSLWIGPSLGALERACLRSVLLQGHRLVLYCYSAPEGVPEGVEIADARTVLPEAEVTAYRSGSYSLFSNRFRYEAQRRGLGTWVDCDLYLLKPLDMESPLLMGCEDSAGTVGTAVLRLPPDSPLLASLLEPFYERIVPWWLPIRTQAAAHARRLITGRTKVADMPWGSTGPKALSAIVRKAGLADRAAPPDIFYPVPWQEARWIVDPGASLEARITSRTVAIHLWNERIKDLKAGAAPRGSFLARLQEEGR